MHLAIVFLGGTNWLIVSQAISINDILTDTYTHVYFTRRKAGARHLDCKNGPCLQAVCKTSWWIQATRAWLHQ